MKGVATLSVFFAVVLLLTFTHDAIALNCLSQRVLLSLSSNDEKVQEMLIDLELIAATLDTKQMSEFEDKVRTLIKDKSKEFMVHYLVARGYTIGAEYSDFKNDKKKAEEFLEKGLESVKKSIKLKGDFSDSHRLAGDLYNWLIDFKFAPLYGPIYASKADKFLVKAKQYDSSNPEVYLAEARKYLYTPILLGGSRRKAMELFKKAVDICPDYYNARLWLGRGYIDRGLIEEGEKSFEKALLIEPNGYMAKEELKKIKNKR